MSLKWESVIFGSTGISPVDIATSLSELTPTFASVPKVMVHLMYSSPRCYGVELLSCELTSFRTKPVLLKPGGASEVDREIFDATGMHFRTPEVLAAKHIASKFGRAAIYVHYNHVHGSFGYVLFENDKLTRYHIVNWEGIATVTSTQTDISIPFVQLVNDTFPLLKLRGMEDMFDCFYSEESRVETFLLAEKGEPVQPVRRLYDLV